MKSNQEIYRKRNQNNTRFESYLPNFLSIPFKERLQKDNKKFSEWLKENVEKYLKKN